jgi:hypothetical protein
MTAGEFSTFSMDVLCPTSVLMLLTPYLCQGLQYHAPIRKCRKGWDDITRRRKDHSPYHSWSFEPNSPPVHSHIRWESHGCKHFRAEHATVPDFDPFFKEGMPSEDLKRRLSSFNQYLKWRGGSRHTSVYGLYAGLNLRFFIPIFLKKVRIKPGRLLANVNVEGRWTWEGSTTHQLNLQVLGSDLQQRPQLGGIPQGE